LFTLSASLKFQLGRLTDEVAVKKKQEFLGENDFLEFLQGIVDQVVMDDFF